MYSPYGSYSSMSSATQPLDIGSGSFLTRDSSYHASCAYPSWPQRSCLSDSVFREERATSYLSDDDLFPRDPLVDDDARSVSSAGSSSTVASASPPALTSQEELLALEAHQAAMQREALRFIVNEKERRRQQAKRQRRSSGGAASSSSKKSPKAKSPNMTSIAETGE
ncbi:hypothetical protein F5Y15DRAFT_58720 [Xylariaceae sp. FL0016]|nr:hypothetical protein F5Y15DRAFT_58720 [Xylariaceae sp. FL0016]